MIILGIETTSEIGSVALVKDGELLSEHILEQPLRHSRYVIPAIDKLLHESHIKITDIDKIAVGVGPGSFTGIRVGIAIAKGLSCDDSILLCGVPSMENMAMKAQVEQNICIAVYAQRNEFFVQCFSKTAKNVCNSLAECRIMRISDIIDKFEQNHTIYSPNVKKFNTFTSDSSTVKEIYPSAQYAAYIAHNTPARDLTLVPVYIRRSEAEERGAKVYKF